MRVDFWRISLVMASALAVSACNADRSNEAASANESAEAPDTNAVTPAGNDVTNQAGGSTGGDAVLVALQKVEVPAQPNDPITSIADAHYITGIGGHFIVADVKYGGGCKTHEFTAYWDGAWNKSNPPGIAIQLRHDKKGDTCKAIVETKLQINISEPANIERRFWAEIHGTGASSNRVDIEVE